MAKFQHQNAQYLYERREWVVRMKKDRPPQGHENSVYTSASKVTDAALVAARINDISPILND